MKKFYFAILVLFSMCCISFAGEPCPKSDGSDCLIPDRVIKAIPGFDASQPVYAAYDDNGWFVVKGKVNSSSIENSRIIKEGKYWRARDLRGERFHPVQLRPDGKPKWALLETVYSLDEPCIDTSGSGPCLICE